MLKNFLKKKVIASFDYWSGTYTDNVVPKLERRGYGYQKLAKDILNYLRPANGSTIAELGAGTGVLGREIKKLRPDLKLVGFDISLRMLQQAKGENIYSELLLCDAEKIPVQDGYFDHVYSAFMFHSALNPKKGLAEVKRIVRDDGRVALIDLFRTRKRVFLFSWLKDNWHSFRYEKGAPSNYCRVEEFRKMAGLSALQINYETQLDRAFKIDRPVGAMTHYFFGMELR
jgi:ubiquinone/menaquinone biosynthesis C-methylase UbiE